MTALGIYLITCLIFILMAILELFIVLLLKRTQKKDTQNKLTRLDMYSLVITSVIFIFFNIGYWMTYLTESNAELEGSHGKDF